MKVILLLIVALVNLNAFAENTVRNGGDAVASEFVSLARVTLANLKSANKDLTLMSVIHKIEGNLDSIKVNSQTLLFLNGDEVDAINYPELGKIMVSRSRWKELKFMKMEVKIGFVLHEYLGVNGFDDQSYQLSLKLVEVLNSQILANLVFLDSFFQVLLELHSTFWYYQVFSEALNFGKFCMNIGEVRSQVLKISLNSNQFSTLYVEGALEKTIKDLDQISSRLQQICLSQSENVAEINSLSSQGIDVISRLQAAYLR